MTTHGWIQLLFFVAVLTALVKPLGAFMARVYEFKPLFGLDRALGPVEKFLYWAAGVKRDDEQSWKQYALACLAFNLIGLLAVYFLQRIQQHLPLDPAAMPAVSPDSSFNTAVSFASNTNWQGYAGETTMSYLTQMLALTVQNFLSAATVIGFGTGDSEAKLYVTLADLAHPEGQNLLVFNADSNRIKSPGGSVAMIAAHTPWGMVAKYALDKDATSKDLKQVATAISNQITKFATNNSTERSHVSGKVGGTGG
jgi:hypothetical protein